MLRALERVEGGTIELKLPNGNVRRFGSGRPVTVEVASRDVFRRLLWSPRMGLGESYVAGDWDADDLPWFFEMLVGAVECVAARLAARPVRALPAARLAAAEPASREGEHRLPL